MIQQKSRSRKRHDKDISRSCPLFLAAQLLTSCGSGSKNPNLDRKSFKIISKPDSVLVWRTEGFVKKLEADSQEHLELFYQKSGEGVSLSPDLADKMSRILTSKEVTEGPRASCIYTPGFVATFTRG